MTPSHGNWPNPDFRIREKGGDRPRYDCNDGPEQNRALQDGILSPFQRARIAVDRADCNAKDFKGLGAGKTVIGRAIAEAKNHQNDEGCRVIVLGPDKGVVGRRRKVGLARVRRKRTQGVMLVDSDWA